MIPKFKPGDHVVNDTPTSDNYMKCSVVEKSYLERNACGYIEEWLLLVGEDNSGRRGPNNGKAAMYFEHLAVVKKRYAENRKST